MSSSARTALVIGSLLASISLADAGGRSALETYPTLSAAPPKPVADNTPAPPPATAAPAPAVQPPGKPGSDARTNRRGRRSRLAEMKAKPTAAAPAKPVVAASAPAAASTAPALASAGPAPDRAGPAPDHPAAAPVVAGHAALQPGQEPAAKTPAESRAAAESPQEKGSPTLAALIAKHAHENGIPVSLAQAVVRIESRGNVRASHGGALGLMQIKAGTARAAGFNGVAAGLLDAETNLHFGMKVLADAYRVAGGDVCRTLMKYQSGHFATHMTRANRTYCSKARAVMAGA